MPLDQRCDVGVELAADQIAFPMTGDGSVGSLRRAFTDRYRINDPSASLAFVARRACMANLALCTQVLRELLSQNAAALHEQRAIDGLVGHPHTLIVLILPFNPRSDLLW
jgi:hypothetical protein